MSIINRAINLDEISITKYELIHLFLLYYFTTPFISLNVIIYLNICAQIIDQVRDHKFHWISCNISTYVVSIIVRVTDEITKF